MSHPTTLENRPTLRLREWPLPLLATILARVLERLPPRRLRLLLTKLSQGARPATVRQAEAARAEVLAVSVRCSGKGCLQRSLATALLCRIRGTWPTWCTGVRINPFSAHAWVQVNDTLIGESVPAGYYHPIITVPPASR